MAACAAPSRGGVLRRQGHALRRIDFGNAPAGGPAALDENDEVDGFRDQRARRRFADFHGELFEARQRRRGRIGMKGCDAAGMTGVPRLEEIERLGSAHLAHDDAVGPQPEGRADQIRERDRSLLGAERYHIVGGALQFAGVLEDDDTLAQPGDLVEEGVGERRLARARSARDDDVRACPYGTAEFIALLGRGDAESDILVQREDAAGRLADRKTRPACNRRQHALEPLAAWRQFRGDDRPVTVGFGAGESGDEPDDAFGFGRFQPVRRGHASLADLFKPEPSIRIGNDLDRVRRFKHRGDGWAQRCRQHGEAARRVGRVRGGHSAASRMA